MGLSDVYYNRPWVPADDTLRRLDMGAQALGDLPRRQLENQGLGIHNQLQQQALADAQYNSPARAANPQERNIGDFVRQLMRNTPGHTPEHEERLMQELSGGQSPNEAAPQNLGQPPEWAPDWSSGRGSTPGIGYPGPMGLGQAPGMPEVSVSREPMSMNGEPMRTPLNANRSFAMDRNAPPVMPKMVDAQEPMTQGDVTKYMRMGPLVHQVKSDQSWKEDVARGKLQLDKDKAANLDKYRQAALEAKQKIAELKARVQMATSDTDRKAGLELLKIKMQELGHYIGYLRSTDSGLTGIVNKDRADVNAEDIQKSLDETQKEVDQLSKQAPTKSGSKGGTKSVSVTMRYRGNGNTTQIPVDQVQEAISRGWELIK